MDKELIQKQRYFLKTHIRKQIDMSDNDQAKGIVMPPIEKAPMDEDIVINLIPVEELESISDMTLTEAIETRSSKRKYVQDKNMSLKELSYLLWVTQGVRKVANGITLRTVPSSGNRHPFDTYLAVFNVEGLDQGIYRYLPSTHQLVFVKSVEKLADKLSEAAKGQLFVSMGAATFIWVAVPYRTEWRYMYASHKSILLDAGHVCQNLYLGCEALGYGTCAIGSYDQDLMDDLLGVDGNEEFSVYAAPVGK